MKNKTDAQKALEEFPPKRDTPFDTNYIAEWAFNHQDIVRSSLNMLTNPEKLNTSEKHVNETPNNEHVIQSKQGLINLDVQILLDTLSDAAKGKTIEPEMCKTIEAISKGYGKTDFGKEDIQALYDCGHKQSVNDDCQCIQSKQEMVDIEGLKKTVDDCENTHGMEKGFYWQAYRHGWNECIDHLHKNGHLNTIPSDMVLVPREPTDEMLKHCGCMDNYDTDHGTDNACADQDHINWYKAMIQASEVK